MRMLYDGGPYELLPDSLKTPEHEAIGYAVTEALKKMLGFAQTISLYADLSSVPDEILHVMALELRTQYYDASADRAVREVPAARAARGGRMKRVRPRRHPGRTRQLPEKKETKKT